MTVPAPAPDVSALHAFAASLDAQTEEVERQMASVRARFHSARWHGEAACLALLLHDQQVAGLQSTCRQLREVAGLVRAHAVAVQSAPVVSVDHRQQALLATGTPH